MPQLGSFDFRQGSPDFVSQVSRRPSGWLLILCVMLCIWEPLTLALEASAEIGPVTLGRIERAAFLTFRVFVAGVGVAAGVAIWNRQMHAFTLAQAALALSAAAAVIRLTWFPGNVPPGMRLPVALLLVGYNCAWYLYLALSRKAKITDV